MRRRAFMGLLGGAAVWPRVAHAQQTGRPRRIAALWPFNETDPDGQAALGARSGLRERGWDGIVIERRWGGGNVERTRSVAAELAGVSPEVILA